MAEEKNLKIALITEDQGIQEYVSLILVGENYDVKTYFTQEEALAGLGGYLPDLVISDFQSPHINGMDICKALRRNYMFVHTPLIFILEETGPLTVGKVVYSGADDYVQKSTIEEEFLLRVKLNLHRAMRQQDVNLITRLPGQAGLLKELQKRIDAKSVTAVCSADLLNFKDFNRRYGFKRGDEVIEFTSGLITRAMSELGSPTDFLAHPQGDDFIFITFPEGAEIIANKIIKDFDANILSFYDEEDRIRGHILLKSRKGEILKIPLLRVHIGIVTNEYYPFINPAQVIQIAVELNDFAQKNFGKSMFVKERRKEYPFLG